MEANNNAEIRKLLSKAVKRLEHVTGCDMHFFHPDATSCDGKTSMGECNHLRTCELIFEARKALAKPQRNCDVGTETEQQDRFDAFCHNPEDCRDCRDCNANRMGFVDCRIVWANMPYQENTK